MSPIFSFFDLAILICIVQGIFFSALLFTAKESKISKRLLGTALIILCVVSFRIVFHQVGWPNILAVRYFPLAYELYLPPLFYLYVKSLVEHDFKWQSKYWLYFILPMAYSVYDFSLYFSSLTLETIPQQNQLSQQWFYRQLNEIEDVLIIISSFIYLFFSLKLMFEYGNKVKALNLKPAKPVYSWLKKIMLLMGIIAIFLLINELVDFYYINEQPKYLHWRLFNLFLAATVYYIAFKGFKMETMASGINQKHIKTVASKITSDKNRTLEKNLIQLLESERIYLDPDLTLKQVANKLEVSSENLSFVINQKFDMNFRDLINSYRINSVKSQLDSEETNTRSILEIALDSGFNSQASFYRAFKKFENMTPKAYLDSKS